MPQQEMQKQNSKDNERHRGDREQRSSSIEKTEKAGLAGPIGLMRRMGEDMDQFFNEFFGISPWARRVRSFGAGLLDMDTRWPQIEVHQKGNKLVVVADLPGMSKDDLSVEVRDQILCISGERHEESESKDRGYRHSERAYGSFCRTVPLPRGAKAETASASFEKGVLQIEIEAPVEASRIRRVEVREPPSH